MAEEKTKVFGVRLENEELEKINTYMQEEGKKNREFMQMLINLYELQKGKAKNINLVGDIEELEKYTSKMHQAFINIIDKLEGQKECIAEEKNNELQIYKEKVNALKKELEELKENNSINEERLNAINIENNSLKEQNTSLQESLKDKSLIVEEYKEKNDTMTGLLHEYKDYKVETEQYKSLLADAQAKSIELSDKIKAQELEVEKLKLKLEDLKKEHEKELKKVAELKDFEKEKLLLKQEKEHNKLLKMIQEEIQEVKAKNNKEIEEYQNKYKALLEELENERKAKEPKVIIETPKEVEVKVEEKKEEKPKRTRKKTTKEDKKTE